MYGADTELGAVIATARGLSRHATWLLAAAATSLLLALPVQETALRYALLASGLTLVALVLLLRGVAALGRWREGRRIRTLARLVGADAAPCFVTDDAGAIGFRNAAAMARFGEDAASTLLAVLHDHFASPGAVLLRLQSRAANTGAAREDVVTRRGHLRLSVHRIGDGHFLWRIEEFQERSPAGRGAEGLSLPMIVANRTGVVLFSNEAMRRVIGERPKRLDRIFLQSGFQSGDEVQIASATGPIRAIVAEVEGAGDRREIFLLPAPPRYAADTVPTDFENVPVALMRFDADGELRIANRAARLLLGMEEGFAPGLAFHELFEDLGRPVNDWLLDVAESRLPAGAEVLRLRVPGEERFAQVQLGRIVERGRAGVLAILSDATALKKLETQFDQSQKMQAIGQLAGGIAHDFNNLLTAISGHCDLLLLRHDPEDAEYADLEQIRQNTNRAAALVSQLLAFSRKQALRPERLELQDVLSEVSHLLNRLLGERIALTLQHGPDAGPIRADRRRLEQVLVNLAVNARDAMPEGGTIRIETAALTLAQPMQRGRATIPAGSYAVVRVIDTGTGIPPENLERIFEPFFTTKRPGDGTGLGLSTVYGIVKQSGGYVFVDSEPGAGTRFEILFPVHRAEDPVPVLPEPGAPALQLRRASGVVLLVEDEAPVRAFVSRALRLQGYTVIEAENAEDALGILDDPSLMVDVFLTDVVMPGMDGPTWVRRALEERPDVRVIFVSGYAEDSLNEDLARIPDSVFLAKPFTLHELIAVVQGSLS